MQKNTISSNLIEEEASYKISAKVVDRENGMQEYENIRMVRISSKDYNLLVMEDFMPVIGQINGSVELVTESNVIPFAPIHGFYMHKKNCFYLLIEDHEDDSSGQDEEDELD